MTRKRRKLRVGRIFIILFVLLLIPFGVALRNRIKENQFHQDIVEEETATLHNYNWANLTNNNGIFHYEDENYTSTFGIDVSYAQGDINWQLVKESGVEFAFIRAAVRGYKYGELSEDTYFRYNIEEALKNNIHVGVYIFSQSISEQEAIEDARYVVNLLQRHSVNCPIVFDMERVTDEDRIKDLSVSELTKVAYAFCHEVKRLGYEPIIYGSDYWLNEEILVSYLQDECKFWLAHYGVDNPSFIYELELWQYSSEGTIDGIETPVDLNIWFKKKKAD